MSTPKWDRLVSRFKQQISTIILSELRDPRLGFITVTGVELSKDKQFLKVFLSVLGDESAKRTTMRGLESSRGYIQSVLNERMHIQHTPRLRFMLDESIQTGIEITKLIREARASDPDGGQNPDESAPPDDDVDNPDDEGEK